MRIYNRVALPAPLNPLLGTLEAMPPREELTISNGAKTMEMALFTIDLIVREIMKII